MNIHKYEVTFARNNGSTGVLFVWAESGVQALAFAQSLLNRGEVAVGAIRAGLLGIP